MRALLPALLACACATSPLIRPGDRDFDRARTRLDVTASRVLDKADPETTLFLQAESLYRDRFGLRLHGARSLAEQVVAATIDFGPLAVLAANNGIADLRLLAYDGAAQLYEAQLSRYPQGRLAQLGLYRLGWAYRSIALDDWPRGSDASFAEAEKRGGELGQLAQEARRQPWKSQSTAVGLSVLPGLGQIYTGETGNGVVRMILAAGFLALAVLPAVAAVRDGNASLLRVGLSTAGFVGLQVSYTTAYQDAQRASLEFNERAEAAFEDAHPSAP